MRRTVKLFALTGVLALVAASCDGGGAGGQLGPVTRGGTLEIGLEADVDSAFDPQKEYYSVTWGFYHCCLARTLLATEGVSTDQGGDELQPDLAAEMPQISEDGLVYTFTLRDGLMWGPPFQDRPIVAQDFITALEREATGKVGAGYAFYYSVIEGFDDFEEAGEISGLRAIDDRTLEITLTRPAGDFLFRMAMPATAPIPTGAEEGHEDDYGRFLVSSGPYMFEGSENLDFDAPPADQEPVSGYVPGRSIVLVRNPSWSRDIDPLRPAFVDRIEAEIGITVQDQQNKIDRGELHLSYDYAIPPDAAQRYSTDPDLQNRIFTGSGDGLAYASMNLGEPPFDDIHVRKATNLAIDKAGLVRIAGGEAIWGRPVGHVIFDSLLDNKLVDYDPYATPNSAGDIEAAKQEMAQSKYDTDGDGVCDDPSCDGIVTSIDEADPYPDQAALIGNNLEPLGMSMDISQFDRTTHYDKCNDPSAHVAFCPSVGWFKDYPDATTFGEPLFGSSALGPDSCCNYSLLGASPEFLEENGYEVTEIPSVDDRFEPCDELPLGDERFECWAELDRTLMEDVVPWVPLATQNETFAISEQVTRYRFDQFSSGPALDQIAVTTAA